MATIGEYPKTCMSKAHGRQVVYNALFAYQNGVCAICKKPSTLFDPRWKKTRKLAFDHNHQTNEIRGLLCHHCNVGIGQFQEDPKLLQAAIDYLTMYAAEKN